MQTLALSMGLTPSQACLRRGGSSDLQYVVLLFLAVPCKSQSPVVAPMKFAAPTS